MALVEHCEDDFKSGTTPEESPKWHQTHERAQTNPSEPLTEVGFLKLKYAVLTAYSYVHVSLGEYMLAYEYAETLLKLPDLTDAYK